MTLPIHQQLAAGAWNKLSLAEQLGNIGSETSRAARWQGKNEQLYQGSITRAFELLDLTIQDPRWISRLSELVRVREVLGDACLGGYEYGTTFADLQPYFDQFVLSLRVLDRSVATD